MIRRIVFVPIIFAISGCATTPAQLNKPPTLAPLSDVLDLVKSEINVFMSQRPPTYNSSSCNVSGGTLLLDPKSLKVTLETAFTNKAEPSIGFSLPFGVISIDPSYGGAYSLKHTQTLVLPLGINYKNYVIPPPITLDDHEIANAMVSFRKELIRTNHDQQPCFMKSDNPSDKITITVLFDVVNQTTGGFALKIFGVNLGAKDSVINEAHQKLEFSFDLGQFQSAT